VRHSAHHEAVELPDERGEAWKVVPLAINQLNLQRCELFKQQQQQQQQ
jgi:hypothetical protein